MTYFKTVAQSLVFFFLVPIGLWAQNENEWPKDIISGEYTISIYQPENASYIDNKLASSSAFGVKKSGQEPVFGMLWTTSILDVDRENRRASLASVTIDEIRLPKEVTAEQKAKFQS